MTDLQRFKAKAQEVRLSLEALSTVGKPKPKDRHLSEAVAEWRDQPLPVSEELKSILASKESGDV